MKAGEAGSTFYAIVEGTAKVVRRGRPPARLGPGAFFGEIAILDPSARVPESCTVGPYCVIGANVELGDNCELISHVTIIIFPLPNRSGPTAEAVDLLCRPRFPTVDHV